MSEAQTGTAMFTISHYCLIVSDLERSIEFYRHVMGMRLRSRVTRTEDISFAIARPGSTMHNAILYFADSPHPALELIRYEPAGAKVDLQIPNPGTSHIAFEVADIHAAVTALRAHDVAFVSPPVHLEPNPVTGARGGTIAYFTDPDGISLELYQAPEPVDPADAAPSA